jgi:hypothetical protein
MAGLTTASTVLSANPGYLGGTYDCSSVMTGGLAYEPTTQQWGSARLKDDLVRFKLKLTPLSKTDEIGSRLVKVTIETEGSHDPIPCWTIAGNAEEVPLGARDRTLSCKTFARSYRFNIETNRFIAANLNGYIDGDKAGDTPYLALGKCTPADAADPSSGAR